MEASLYIVNKISFKNGVHIFLEENSLEDMAKRGWFLSRETADKLIFINKQGDDNSKE